MYKTAPTTVDQVARYVIWQSQEIGDPVTNLKLQKLLYYIQGWYLGLNETPLFSEDFQAWVHGPVQPDIFHKYKQYRWNPIGEEVAKPTLDGSIEQHLKDVLNVYGADTGWELERRTHKEEPWLKARGSTPPDESSTTLITTASMQSYFKNMADDES